MYPCVSAMAGEPAGRGPNDTCLATWAKARWPSKPPVFSGGGASAGSCVAAGGAVVTPLMKGASFASGCGLSALALQPRLIKDANTHAAAQSILGSLNFIY